MTQHRMSARIIVRTAIFAASLATLGCGPRAGTGVAGPDRPGPRASIPDAYTSEYEASWALEAVGAGVLHALGGTGKGTTIGVVDVDASPQHRELAGKYEAVHTHGKPWSGNAHGGAVTAVMVARRDARGMHGIAYEATVQAVAGTGRTGSGLSVLNRAAPRVRIANSSVGGRILPDPRRFLSEARRYVDAGGVIVYAAGNRGRADAQHTAAAPAYEPQLEAGWLAVASIGLDGAISGYSNRCGIAARWCVAAPGDEIATIDAATTDGYATRDGTSYAAPIVTGGIAALKGVFPGLSFRQLRTRVLASANRTGIYADEERYGQGLVDFAAATRPIGGTYLPEGPTDAGPVHGTGNAHVTVGARFATALAQEPVLVLDGLQRAPFLIRAGTLATPARRLLALEDLELSAPPPAREHRIAWQTHHSHPHARYGAYRLRPGAIGARVRLAQLPGKLEIAAAVSPATAAPDTAGIAGWDPEHILAASLEPRPGTRLGASLGTGLRRPGGIAATGPLAIDATSIQGSYERTMIHGGRLTSTWRARLGHLARSPRSGLVSAGDAWVGHGAGQVSVRTGQRTWIRIGATLERAFGTVHTSLRAGTRINDNGTIAYRRIALDDGSLNTVATLTLAVMHGAGTPTRSAVGIAVARDAAGTTDAVVAVRHTIAMWPRR